MCSMATRTSTRLRTRIHIADAEHEHEHSHQHQHQYQHRHQHRYQPPNQRRKHLKRWRSLSKGCGSAWVKNGFVIVVFVWCIYIWVVVENLQSCSHNTFRTDNSSVTYTRSHTHAVYTQTYICKKHTVRTLSWYCTNITLTSTVVQTLYQVASAILNLGNVKFEKVTSGGKSFCKVE